MNSFTDITAAMIASKIDNTILRPFATLDHIKEFCLESREFNFISICVNPVHVKLASEILQGSGIKVCTVIGFPLGANTTEIKLKEAAVAIEEGAEELDMVINIGWLKSGAYKSLESEINTLVNAASGYVVKIIIETCFLTYQDKLQISKIIANSGADFIKTSTGFGTGGATVEDIRILKEFTQNKVKIKASGGIINLKRAIEFLEAGAERLGTSRGIAILHELKTRS